MVVACVSLGCRVAQIVGSWDPFAEKVETEIGNGRKLFCPVCA